MRSPSFLRLRCPSFGTRLAWLLDHRGCVEILEWKDCFEILRKSAKDVAFVWIELPRLGANETQQLKKLKTEFPQMPILLCTQNLDAKMYQKLINSMGLWQIGTPETPVDVWNFTIREAIEYHHNLRRQMHWLAACRNRNTRLIRMTHNLEQQVQKKTKKLFLSMKRLQSHDEQLKRIKALLVDINAAHTIKDIYACLSDQLAHLLPFTELSIVIPDWSGKTGYLAIKGTGSGETSIATLLPNENKAIQTTFNGFEPLILRRGTQLTKLVRSQSFYLKGHNSVLFMPLPIGNQKAVMLIASHDRGAFDQEHLETMRHLQPPLSVALDRAVTMGALKHLQKQWEVTFNAIQNPIFIINENKKITRTNQMADQLLRELPSLQETITTFSYGPNSILKANDREFQVIDKPFRHRKQNLTIVHLREVTEEKQLLQQLLQSEKLASVGILSEKIAHELNNPLAGIMALSQVLQYDLDEPLKSDLQEIEKACRRCKHIIENLVEFSRSTGSKEKSQIDLNKVIQETIALSRAGLTGISLDVSLDNHLPAIQGIFQELQQVIFNLIQNASHSMHGKGSLYLATQFDSKTEHVLMKVRDTGSGIPDDTKEHIFKPFFTTKRAGVGTGLGLSICKSIVKEHEGNIRLVSSQEGEGTEFELSFPT